MRKLPRSAFLIVLVASVLASYGCKKEQADETPAAEAAEAAPADPKPLLENGQVVFPSSENPNDYAAAKAAAKGEDPAAAAPAPPTGAKKANPRQLAANKGMKNPVKPGAAGTPPAAPPAAGDIPAPADVAAAPSDAKTTASGLASKVLSQGKGADRATQNDTVKVHYTGWTTDGKMFDSSVKRGKPAEFPLNGVIAGWTEGLQLMAVGEKRRFWIPEKLAYMGRPGKPAGMLVFDVELLEIKKAPAPPKDLTAAPADAVKTASGLATKVLTPGKGGANPGDNDTVKMNYTGWLDSGRMFDSTSRRGQPVSMPVSRLFDGWKEGLKLMTPGEKRMMWIPASLAPERLPGSTDEIKLIVMEVELLEVISAPATPPDVAAAPADATKTESGLASKVLSAGKGTAKPAATNTVEVHYTGWTTDGKMFDSSVTRGQPAKFALNAVIAGWTEGVQLMVEGEKRRFWIPEDLAYKGRPGAPAGMLVFDVELIKIHK